MQLLRFCSSAVLDPRVGHTMDVLSPFIPVLCHSDWLFHDRLLSMSSCCPSSPACTWHCSLQWRSQGRHATAPPQKKIGFTRKFLLRRWAKYTKLCMVWQPNILNNCYELSGSYAPRTIHQGVCTFDPAWGTSVPQTPVPPTKSWLRHWFLALLR